MGNKVLLKVDSKVSACIEEFVRLLIACGMPKDDLILVHTNGPNMEYLITQVDPKMTQFTGSSKIAEKLSKLLSGRIKVEDAGFDFKILGPDVLNVDLVASISDQDAYALSGQKCSAQSLLFVHKNYSQAKFIDKIKILAEKRSYANKTLSPILTWNNKKISDHIDNLLKIPGSKLLFGGSPSNEQHNIPEVYGSFKPTAVQIPLKAYSAKKHYDTITTELFGPLQIVTEYDDSNLDQALNVLGNLSQFLTAGITSNDPVFLNKVIANTNNGVTYAGIRARTTGAPQNHWFGPCGDPRAGGIGTREAIIQVWSAHREIVNDFIIPKDLKIVQS